MLHCFLQKKRKDGSKELAKGTACWENGKEKAASAELTPEEPRAESTEPPRSRREPSNPKRAPGRSEALGGKSPASPGTQSGPSAKRAVYLKVAPTEEEPNARVTGNMDPGKGHSGRASSRRNGRASQIDAPAALADLTLPLEKVPGDLAGQGTLLPLPCAENAGPIPASGDEVGSGMPRADRRACGGGEGEVGTLQLLCCGANGAELTWDVWGKQVPEWLAGATVGGARQLRGDSVCVSLCLSVLKGCGFGQRDCSCGDATSCSYHGGVPPPCCHLC